MRLKSRGESLEDILRTAIIDADVICHQAAAYVEGVDGLDWGEATSEPTFTDVCNLADDMIDEWTARAGCTGSYLAFSGDSEKNFRKSVFSAYKDNRKGQEKPEYYYELREYLMNEYPSERWPNLEGDDVIGLLLTEGSVLGPRVAVSTDKDIKTLPGLIMRVPFNKDGDWIVVDNNEFEADRFWMYQTICGDSADGYKGAPGAGPKRAHEALADCTTLSEMWAGVLEVYQECYQKPRWRSKFWTGDYVSEAIMNARCARILRDGDYDYETEEVKLWLP
jgi:DNA polymerase-1